MLIRCDPFFKKTRLPNFWCKSSGGRKTFVKLTRFTLLIQRAKLRVPTMPSKLFQRRIPPWKILPTQVVVIENTLGAPTPLEFHLCYMLYLTPLFWAVLFLIYPLQMALSSLKFLDLESRLDFLGLWFARVFRSKIVEVGRKTSLRI